MEEVARKKIGIIGGMGPYAGIDLFQKVHDEVIASRDADHLDVCLISEPHRIQDRTDFIFGKTTINPASSIVELIGELVKLDIDIVGIPCNTAHSEIIFNHIWSKRNSFNREIRIVNIIQEVAKHIKTSHANSSKVGLLSTQGTYAGRTYHKQLEQLNYTIIEPNSEGKAHLHNAIYNEHWGLKAKSNPTTVNANKIVNQCIRGLINSGAEIVILACTELSLAIPDTEIAGVSIIDSTRILARALVREACKDKLRPY
jgi:aspartate racemase